ncbi:M61 family metallopeptidase [Rhodoferax sp.]|uniref:M61 family metallopeptidase n=1 Tax=Rhodoferax sp. TaxID=50421 RepID=UPI0027195CDC|nr:peptidase M61 [Rhodoferax sp.]MDO8321111.1 peptidase M61 [Rhodoferax sp.]
MGSLTHSTAPALVGYVVRALDLQAHLFEVTLTVAQVEADQVVSLPVWIPGSYLVREFAKHLQGLQARQGNKPVAITQRDKCSWQIHTKAGKALVLKYQVYAFDSSVRTAWLDTQRGFFNGTSLCLRVHGQEDTPHQLGLSNEGLPKDWQAATALRAQRVSKRGFGDYLADSYDELVDSPVELGAFWRGEFVAAGIKHHFIVSGASASFDGARLLADTQAICEAEISFWHGRQPQQAPQRHYLFMLNAVHDGYGGLEHRHSTALICKRADLPRHGQAKSGALSDGYTTLLGLISHEYFHTWNVKRLRPAEFARYDYAQENYTDLLWFFEGFTSYFDVLLLRRAKLIDNAHYLKLLAKTINQVLQTPGRQLQSVAQSSRDAWVKYYRQDENTANATVSYYTKGALVALCLDLSLRHSGKTSLDAVMRALWLRCQGGPMTQDDLLAVLADLSGQSYAVQVQQWVHGTADLPLKKLLKQHGIHYEEESASRLDQLGMKVSEQQGIRVKSVLRASAAEQAGFAAGDEWLGVATGQGKTTQRWRLNKLDDLATYLGSDTSCRALVARDQRLLTLPLNLPDTVRSVTLTVADTQPVNAWLDGKRPA